MRDVAFERRETVLAAGRAPSAALIAFAEERAGTSDVRDVHRRDFGREVLEELADCRNYLVWWMGQLDDLADRAHVDVDEVNRARGWAREALAATARAYDAATHAQAATAGARRGVA
jgi:hypothetical protein